MEITSIVKYEDRIEVEIIDIGDVTAEVVQPYHIVKIPATVEGNFVFELQE
jgi:hypothetical protein